MPSFSTTCVEDDVTGADPFLEKLTTALRGEGGARQEPQTLELPETAVVVLSSEGPGPITVVGDSGEGGE